MLKQLAENNTNTIVWFYPIFPFINDTEENQLFILEGGTEAEVKAILCFSTTLCEGYRGYLILL